MKIATLQFDPKIGDVEGNIRRADEILKGREYDLRGLDLLVLPEMAFTGLYMIYFLYFFLLH